MNMVRWLGAFVVLMGLTVQGVPQDLAGPVPTGDPLLVSHDPPSMRRSATPSARREHTAVSVPAPWNSAVPYGDHPRQVLDVYRPTGTEQCSVVYFVHGGGWNSRSRTNVHELLDVPRLISRRIAVVAIDYRFISDAEAAGVQPPVRWPLEDAARALQFTRFHAAAWGLNKNRIAGCGGSAGGCSVLWLALRDDLAQPDSADPIARESTRLCFVAAAGAQTSLDPLQMRDWIPNITYGAHAFGFRSQSVNDRAVAFERFLANRDRLMPAIREYSPLEHASADDPPLWLYYSETTPVAKGDVVRDPTHTSLFGLMAQERLASFGVPVIVTTPARPAGAHATLTDALIAALSTPSFASHPP